MRQRFSRESFQKSKNTAETNNRGGGYMPGSYRHAKRSTPSACRNKPDQMVVCHCTTGCPSRSSLNTPVNGHLNYENVLAGGASG